MRTLRDNPSLGVAAAILGRRPRRRAGRRCSAGSPTAFAVAAVATIPFRIPISVAGSTSNLLLPLYLVVAAGALAWAVPRLPARAHRRRLRRRVPPGGRTRPDPGWVERLLAITLVLYAAQSAYADDSGRALENVVFFYVPFALLYVAAWRGWRGRRGSPASRSAC